MVTVEALANELGVDAGDITVVVGWLGVDLKDWDDQVAFEVRDELDPAGERSLQRFTRPRAVIQLVEVPGKGWVEIAPQACPECGYPGPGWALVGSSKCTCSSTAALGLHRSYACKSCHAETFVPPLTDDCRSPHFGFDRT